MKKSLMFMFMAASLVACNNTQSTEKSVAVEEEAIVVKTVVAEMKTVDVLETYTSEIMAFKENDITPAAQGLHIDRILVDVGDKVVAGQTLVTLDQTTLKQQELNLATTQDSYNRMKPVHEAGGVADQQMIQLKNQLDLQKEVVENLRKNSTIKSPISGVVTARNYDNGDMVAGMPIFVVQRINPVKIFVNVSESLYSYIKKGMSVDVELDAIPEKKFEGKVSRITPLIDPQTRTFEVELTVANGKEEIKPGMYARATMSYGSRKNVVVPDRAVVKMMGSGDRFIYVLKADGTVSYQKVELGRRMNDKFEVLSGVADGDEVVVSGQSALKNGIAVERVK